MNKNILLCGVGGQGTVLASKLIASAAMAKGIDVMSAETIGMAQRGGSVFSHLRLGEGLYSPMMGTNSADLIIGFEPGEAVRMLPYLKKDGCVVVNSRAVMPVTASLSDSSYNGNEMTEYLRRNVNKLIIVDGGEACRALGNGKVLNTVLLGAAVRSGVLGLTTAEIKDAILRSVKPQFHELNLKALEYAQI